MISVIIVLFALIGTFSSFPQSFAGSPSFGASQCNLPGQENSFNADESQGEKSWTIPNHEISLDSNAGPWKKNLLPVGGTGNVQVDDSIDPDTPQTFFLLEETITVGPGGSFTDWHEEIVNPGWIWEYSDFSTFPPDQDFIATEMGDETNSLTIFFEPPLPPGTKFLIEKSLVFVGPDGMLDTDADYPDPPDTRETSSFSDVEPLTVLQYPTGNISCDPDGSQPVGGENMPIELTSLILANTQSNAMWILPLLITLVGIGVLILRKN